MTTGFEMRASIREDTCIVPHFSLFDPKGDLSKSIVRFRCFTYRDGSRYYREFFAEIMFIKEFLDGKKILREYPDLGFMKGLIEALEAWRRNHHN